MPAQDTDIQAGVPELSEEEKRQAEERTAITPQIVHEAIRYSGETELCRPASALAWSALAAGLSMGFSLVCEGLLRSRLPDTPWRPLISKLGYPFGFLIVIIGRQQLFTESTLTVIIPLLARRNLSTLYSVARLWGLVLTANLAGAHIMAWVLAVTPVFQPDVKTTFLEIGQEAMAVDFGTAVLKGIFAGWLIAMVVWMLAASDSGRIAIIVILTYAVGLAGLTHIIAGSVEALFVVMSGHATWLAWLTGYMIPALIGNTIGGVALVSALNHAQVISGRGQKHEM